MYFKLLGITLLLAFSYTLSNPVPDPSDETFNFFEDRRDVNYTEDKIVDGASLAIDRRPYQVAVLPKGYLCGGSLITSLWFITAAHCAVGEAPSNVVVRAGSYHYNYGGVLKQVRNIIVHPKYNARTHNHDIAIMRTYQPFDLSMKSIGVAKLSIYNPGAGHWVYVTGYGTLRSNGNIAPHLMGVWLKVVKRSTCNKAYGDITKYMVCASLKGKDSCQGDSGGPLTLNGELVGVVSFGNGCATPGYPGVYTLIAPKIGWLKSHIPAL